MQDGSRKTILAAFAANLGIAIAKFIGFAFTGAASMLSEGVHSVADTTNQGLLLLGSKKARRAPTERHPFGFGRERYFWAFIVALVIFALGSAFAIVEGIDAVRHPEPLDSAVWAIGILGVSVLLESFSFRTAAKEARKSKGDQTWFVYINSAKAPEIPLVLLEDFGALIGLAVALSAVTLTLATDNGRWDGVGAIIIGVVLGAISILLAIKMKSLLIGESADAHDVAAIRAAILSAPHTNDLIHLRTQHFGPDELLVTAKIVFGDSLHGQSLADAIDATERRIRDAVPTSLYLFIEPDVRHEGEVPQP